MSYPALTDSDLRITGNDEKARLDGIVKNTVPHHASDSGAVRRLKNIFIAGADTLIGVFETKTAGTDNLAQQYYYQPSDFAVVDAVSAVAARRGVPNAQVALAWVLAQPGVTAPIVGASKLPQLDDALAALEIRLSDDEIKELSAPYAPHPVLGHR